VDACVRQCDIEKRARADADAEKARRIDVALENLDRLQAVPPINFKLPETPSCDALAIDYVEGNAALAEWQRTHAARYSGAGGYGEVASLQGRLHWACRWRHDEHACTIDQDLMKWLSAPENAAYSSMSPPDDWFAMRDPRCPAPAPPPECADGTWWDGFACAHARATCGGWDGASCDPAPLPTDALESAEERELAAIDDEARWICPEDDGALRPYSGDVFAVKDNVEVEWKRAASIDARLERLSGRALAPRWRALAAARAGSLYDCIWTTLRRASMTYAAHERDAGPAKARPPRILSAPAANSRTDEDVIRLLESSWREVVDRFLARSAEQMFRDYVTADLLARRFAVGGAFIARARERLPLVVQALGDWRVHELLTGLADPTDPSSDPKKRRTVRSVPGMKPEPQPPPCKYEDYSY
jgi:hypothetical protein